MTKAEKIAYEAGKTLAERGIDRKAPCYDPIMNELVFEPRSEAGHKRLEQIFRAWYSGADIPFPE